MPSLISILFMASALGSLLGSLAKPAWILGNETLRGVFVTSALWLALRVLGGVLSTCVALQWGPEWIIGMTRGRSPHRACRHHFLHHVGGKLSPAPAHGLRLPRLHRYAAGTPVLSSFPPAGGGRRSTP